MTAPDLARIPCLLLLTCLLGGGLAGRCADAAEARYRGRSLPDVLGELSQSGMRIVYSDDVVRRDMIVATEPAARDGVALLQELLAPFGLATKPVGGDVYAVAVAPRPATSTSGPPAVAVAAPLEQIVVASSRYSLRESVPSVTTFLSQAEVEAVPRLAEDALKVVQRLPGAATNGLSGLAHMRGGEENETLVVFDGLPLYEPFHLRLLQSPTSIIDPRAIDGIDVHVGGFGAEFGDRMSSVIETRSIRPPQARHELGLSLFHTSALAARNYADGRGNWLLSARRSNLDEVADLTDFDRGHPNYSDVFGRVGYRFADGTEATLHALVASDSLSFESSDATELARSDHHNSYFWGTLEHVYSPALRGSLLLSYTDVSSNRRGDVDDPGRRTGTTDDERSYHVVGLRTDVDYERGRWLHRFGAEVRSLSARYDYASSVTFLPDYPFPGDAGRSVDRSVQKSPEGEHISAYFTSRVRATERLTAEIGLRWDEQTYVEDADEQFGPRVNLLYELDDATRLRASWGRYQQAQGIDELQVEDGIDTYARAQRADHLIFGAERSLGADVHARVEVYRKDYRQLRPRYESLFDPLSLVPDLRADRVRIAPDGALARGVELLLSRRGPGPWSGWLGYSWSEVDDDVDGKDVRRSWDQRHAVTAGLTWTKRAWDASLALTVHTGWPRTPVRLVTGADGQPVVDVGPRNGDRYADFATLDLRVARTFALPLGQLTAHAELTNALDRLNPCCVDYTVVDDDGAWRLVSDEDGWLPLVPSIGVLWKF